MKLQVEFTHQATLDVREILLFIRGHSSSGAWAWHKALEEVVAKLSEFTFQGGIAPESSDIQENLRECLFKTRRGRPYRVVFIDRQKIRYILTIRGPGEDLIKSQDLDLPE